MYSCCLNELSAGSKDLRPVRDPLRSTTAAPGAEGAAAQFQGVAQTELLVSSTVRSRVLRLERFRTGSYAQDNGLFFMERVLQQQSM